MGLFTKDNKNREIMIPLTNVSVKATIEGGVTSSEITLDFVNTYAKKPVEVTFEFPVNKKQVLKTLSAKIEDRVVKTKIKAIEEAKNNYQNAIAGGKAAVIG